MILNNKLLINILYLSLFIMAIGGVGILIHHDSLMMFFPVGFIVFIMTGIYLLIKNGEFIKTNTYRYAFISVALILLGSMFKIMHWPFAGPMLGLGLLSFPVIYLYYMISDKHLAWTNFLKLFFVLTLATGRLLNLFHLPYWQIFFIAGIIALVILLIEFIINKRAEV